MRKHTGARLRMHGRRRMHTHIGPAHIPASIYTRMRGEYGCFCDCNCRVREERACKICPIMTATGDMFNGAGKRKGCEPFLSVFEACMWV